MANWLPPTISMPRGSGQQHNSMLHTHRPMATPSLSQLEMMCPPRNDRLAALLNISRSIPNRRILPLIQPQKLVPTGPREMQLSQRSNQVNHRKMPPTPTSYPNSVQQSKWMGHVHSLSVAAQIQSYGGLNNKTLLRGTSSLVSHQMKQSLDPNTVIEDPNPMDVLVGRGGRSNHHEGNERYRQLIRQHRERYTWLPKHEKIKLSRAIVAVIHDLGGRFLEPAANSTNDNIKVGYVVASEKRAVEKTSQCLREKREKQGKRTKKQQQTTATATATSQTTNPAGTTSKAA